MSKKKEELLREFLGYNDSGSRDSYSSYGYGYSSSGSSDNLLVDVVTQGKLKEAQKFLEGNGTKLTKQDFLKPDRKGNDFFTDDVWDYLDEILEFLKKQGDPLNKKDLTKEVADGQSIIELAMGENLEYAEPLFNILKYLKKEEDPLTGDELKRKPSLAKVREAVQASFEYAMENQQTDDVDQFIALGIIDMSPGSEDRVRIVEHLTKNDFFETAIRLFKEQKSPLTKADFLHINNEGHTLLERLEDSDFREAVAYLAEQKDPITPQELQKDQYSGLRAQFEQEIDNVFDNGFDEAGLTELIKSGFVNMRSGSDSRHQIVAKLMAAEPFEDVVTFLEGQKSPLSKDDLLKLTDERQTVLEILEDDEFTSALKYLKDRGEALTEKDIKKSGSSSLKNRLENEVESVFEYDFDEDRLNALLDDGFVDLTAGSEGRRLLLAGLMANVEFEQATKLLAERKSPLTKQDLLSKNTAGETLLEVILDYEDDDFFEALKYLKTQKAPLTADDLKAPSTANLREAIQGKLSDAIENNYFDEAESLIKDGLVDFAKEDQSQLLLTPLRTEGGDSLVATMLKAGADLLVVDPSDNETALHASSDPKVIRKVLIEANKRYADEPEKMVEYLTKKYRYGTRKATASIFHRERDNNEVADLIDNAVKKAKTAILKGAKDSKTRDPDTLRQRMAIAVEVGETEIGLKALDAYEKAYKDDPNGLVRSLNERVTDDGKSIMQAATQADDQAMKQALDQTIRKASETMYSLTPDQLIEHSGGTSKLEQIIGNRALPQLLTFDRWAGDPRGLHKVASRIPRDEMSRQLDGQDGRPTYQQLLSRVNASALKTIRLGGRSVVDDS